MWNSNARNGLGAQIIVIQLVLVQRAPTQGASMKRYGPLPHKSYRRSLCTANSKPAVPSSTNATTTFVSRMMRTNMQTRAETTNMQTSQQEESGAAGNPSLSCNAPNFTEFSYHEVAYYLWYALIGAKRHRAINLILIVRGGLSPQLTLLVWHVDAACNRTLSFM